VRERTRDLEYFLVRLNSHHKIRYSKEFREFLTGETLNQGQVDHLYAYSKMVRDKLDVIRDNKVYTNIMSVA